MNKPMKIDSIYKNIAQFGDILVKHRVHIYKTDKQNRHIEYSVTFTSNKSKAGISGISSISFRGTDDCLILENIPKDLNNKIRPSVYLTYGDIADVKRIFKEAIKWFSEYKNDLFNYENSIPYSVSNKYQNLHTIMNTKIGIKGSYLAIQPAVIVDPLHSIGYPGVIFKSLSGIIGVCTYTELLSLHNLIINSLENLYEISNTLINQYLLLYSIDKGGQNK